MRQTKPAVPIKPFMYFYGIGTPALPFGCFVTLRSLSRYLQLLQHSSRQPLVSFTPLHSLRPSFRYHYTTFVAFPLLLFMAAHLQTHKAKTQWAAHSTTQSLRYNTHWVSLSLHYVLHSFQSGSVHPLPIIFARLACLPQLRVCHGFWPTHNALPKIKNTRQTLAYNVAVNRRFTPSLPPLLQALAATSIRSSFLCLWWLATLLCYSGGYFPPRLCFFWLKAVLPFCQRTGRKQKPPSRWITFEANK